MSTFIFAVDPYFDTDVSRILRYLNDRVHLNTLIVVNLCNPADVVYLTYPYNLESLCTSISYMHPVSSPQLAVSLKNSYKLFINNGGRAGTPVKVFVFVDRCIGDDFNTIFDSASYFSGLGVHFDIFSSNMSYYNTVALSLFSATVNSYIVPGFANITVIVKSPYHSFVSRFVDSDQYFLDVNGPWLSDLYILYDELCIGPELNPGLDVTKIWPHRSFLAAEHAAVGSFGSAMTLLNKQLGIKNFTVLKSMFLDLFTGSHAYIRAFSSSAVISLAVERGWKESSPPNMRGPPALIFSLSQLYDKLEAGYKATAAGKFNEALRLFLNILHTIPLIVVESRSEVDCVKKLLVIVKEYVLGLKMQLHRKELKDNPIRQQELAAYITHCNLQTSHLRLALQSAMTVCFKCKNFATAANFARRLLETNPTAEDQARVARQVIQAAERNMTDAVELNYDIRNPFVICGATYVPIYRGQMDVLCPYCGSHFVPTQEGQICTVCDLAVVGASASGLLSLNPKLC